MPKYTICISVGVQITVEGDDFDINERIATECIESDIPSLPEIPWIKIIQKECPGIEVEQETTVKEVVSFDKEE